MALVMFILKNAQAFAGYATLFSLASWIVMGVALVLTIWSAADYFYHAREVIAGPWSSGRSAGDGGS
jgi:phosphatidylglycerophosphate synthase